jgi:dimethylargininase
MMPIALTRAVSRMLSECEVTYVERSPIDVARAAAQHDAYCRVLAAHGLTVLRLPAQDEMPDAVFVEDPVIVLDEVAIALMSGAASRRAEAESILPILRLFRPIETLRLPGTVDGGDVVRIDRTLFIGRSSRSNSEGIRQLGELVTAHGYRVVPVPMQGCLHLKSGCTWVGDGRVLINPAYVDASSFQLYSPICVPAAEPAAADVLRLGDAVLMPDTFPLTAALLKREGYAVETVDVSEFQKAEAGVTCLSVIFEAEALPQEAAALRLF